jgi:hypothetical protein
MAYLDNSVITVDAVLTKKGRERLGQGRDAFNITKFAVGDDEIDYSLYNTAHPLGTNYYPAAIEAMPVLEAIPDESQVMRYKLVSLQDSQGITRIPQISVGVGTSISINANDTAQIFSPQTTFITTGGTTDQSLDQTFGYTAILFDEEAADLRAVGDRSIPASANYVAPETLGVDPLINFSSTAVVAGFQFQLTAKNVTTQRSTKIRVFGNETGASTTFDLIVNPVPSTS